MAKRLKNCDKHFFCIFEMVYASVVTTKKSQEKIDLEHLLWSRSLWGVIFYNFSQENATKMKATSQLRYGLSFYTLTLKILPCRFQTSGIPYVYFGIKRLLFGSDIVDWIDNDNYAVKQTGITEKFILN